MIDISNMTVTPLANLTPSGTEEQTPDDEGLFEKYGFQPPPESAVDSPNHSSDGPEGIIKHSLEP